MIDPLVSLAFTLYSNRGAYALLLGSGVSRGAGVPTGWEVVLDLTARVVALESADVGSDPSAWYRERYGEEPNYSKLLQALAPEPAERNRLLRGYFEPTEAEREQGLKLPTTAHRAIARLVRDGYVRVIVTTNFDRLLETALQDEGVVPTVLASPDAIKGALPLAHTDCTIVKIHGDYLDARIRNTPDELTGYEAPLDALLDRVFDEYGLVVCGWSAEWDPALRVAIERCQSHRYTTYWGSRGELTGLAARLITARRAVVVPVVDADSFFAAVEEKVTALARVDAPHPLSPVLAAETLKRFLPDPSAQIRLHDLVMGEVDAVAQAADAVDSGPEQPTAQTVRARLERYEAVAATLIRMLVVGGYWGTPAQLDLWVGAIDRLANRFVELGGRETWLRLREYPTVLALYALGLGAVAGGKYENLAAVLGQVTVRQYNEDVPLVQAIPVARVVDERALQREGQPAYHTPASDRLCDVVMREPLREFLPNDERYFDTFDRFEYLLSLAYADAEASRGEVWAPAGSFGWRQRRRENSVYARVEEEARAGALTGLLGDRLFDGSIERFLEIKAALDQRLRALPW